MAQALQPGEVLLLENLRFHAEEEANDPAFAQQLAALGDVYVNDAFGTAHRAHASTEGVAHDLPAVAGLADGEGARRSSAARWSTPKRPFVGDRRRRQGLRQDRRARQPDRRRRSLLIGGGMANTFLKAQRPLHGRFAGRGR